MDDTKLSLGEQRVRIKFNPGADGTVDKIKNKAADLINLINDEVKQPEGLEGADVGEFRRLIALAMTDIENAAMWGVKAATFGK